MDTLPKTVIVAEDEILVRMLAVDSLAEAGFNVIEVRSADQAVLAIGEHAGKVAVLFTDIHMAGSMSGLELAHLVHDRWPAVAVLVTSGHSHPSACDMPMGSRFIAKPYRVERVVSQVKTMSGNA